MRTLVQATSCDVASAHCVAELITLFCNSWSSVVEATAFAFNTNWAVALATALARAIRVSCDRSSIYILKDIRQGTL